MKRPSKPLEYALKLLGQRSYSEKKLAEKLQSREVEPKEIEQVISKLKELGFINDLKFAKDYVERAQNIRFNGRRKIYWQLIKKGVSKDVAKQAIDEAYCEEDEAQTVRKLLNKFAKNIPKDKKMYERLMRRLISRGYGYDLVKRELTGFIKTAGLRREIPR